MADLDLTIAPSAERTSVTLTFAVGGDVLVANCRPAELDALIQALAVARAWLSPPISEAHDDAVISPPVPTRAAIPAEMIDSKRVMLLRHPGLGWLSFELNAQVALDLAACVLPIIQASRSESGG